MIFFANQISFQQQCRKRLREIFQTDISDEQADRLAAIYLKFYESNWGLFDDVIPCLNLFRSLKLGIISNGHRSTETKIKEFEHHRKICGHYHIG